MKRTILFFALITASALANASPALITATPGDANLSTPTGPSITFGVLINFDTLTPNSTLNPGQYAAQGITSISSPDGLTVIPYSTQSFPNEIFDDSSNGAANITISLSHGSNEIGIGIADSDPVLITLQPLSIGGTALGSPFQVSVPENTVNPGNGYYVIADPNYELGGLQILQSSANAAYSGLAIDDLQVAGAPEPASISLALAGILAIGFYAMRRRA